MTSRPAYLCIGILAAIACNSEPTSWNRAVSGNTAAAYENYLQGHPQGPHAAEARAAAGRLRDEADWASATSANSLDAYELYLKQHADGRHVSEAKTAAADALWLSEVRVLEFGAVKPARPKMPEVLQGLTGVVLEFQPQRQDLTFYLTTVNTYLAERSGARAPWALVQPVVPGKAQLFVEGHSVGMATPYGGTIMGQIECEKHTITYHAGFITQIGSFADEKREFFRFAALRPTDDARESLVPLTVTIPRGTKHVVAILFPLATERADLQGVFVAGHKLPVVKSVGS